MPGEILYGEGEIELNAGRPAFEIEVSNTSDRAIQVGSHFHFFEVNRALRFVRAKTFGTRLDIPSGASVRFEAGQTHRVALIPFGGKRLILGFNDLAQGGSFEEAVMRAGARGFDAAGGPS